MSKNNNGCNSAKKRLFQALLQFLETLLLRKAYTDTNAYWKTLWILLFVIRIHSLWRKDSVSSVVEWHALEMCMVTWSRFLHQTAFVFNYMNSLKSLFLKKKNPLEQHIKIIVIIKNTLGNRLTGGPWTPGGSMKGVQVVDGPGRNYFFGDLHWILNSDFDKKIAGNFFLILPPDKQTNKQTNKWYFLILNVHVPFMNYFSFSREAGPWTIRFPKGSVTPKRLRTHLPLMEVCCDNYAITIFI